MKFHNAYFLRTRSGRTIRTARFGEFDDNFDKSKLKARRYIEGEKSGWENVSHSIGRPDMADLVIEEGQA
jgi:hypothetical protein